MDLQYRSIPMTPKRLANFRLEDELVEGLQAVKERDGIPLTEQVRRAIRQWLQDRGVIEKTDRKRVRARKRP
jgi:hypothetical protein